MIVNIYLVRHGETDYNSEGRLQGRLGVNLNRHGIAQARRIPEILRSKDIQAVYTSPLERAKTTCQYLTNELGKEIPCAEIENLTEIALGKYEGWLKSSVDTALGNGSFERWTSLAKENDRADFPGDGVESKMALRERALKALKKIAKDAAVKNKQRIAVIGHGTYIANFLAACLDKRDTHIANGEVVYLTYDTNNEGWAFKEVIANPYNLENHRHLSMGNFGGKESADNIQKATVCLNATKNR